ncbi:hypothetical protein GAY29_21430 [Azospirillum brasilense]|nr:hypothetical protein [Azospirillum brasilense]
MRPSGRRTIAARIRRRNPPQSRRPQSPLPSGERKDEGVALLPNVPPRATPSPALRATLSPEGRGLWWTRPTAPRSGPTPTARPGAPRGRRGRKGHRWPPSPGPRGGCG